MSEQLNESPSSDTSLTKRFGTFKLVMLGESNVGKSSIIQRFTKNMFDLHQEATIGAAFITKIFQINQIEKGYVSKIKYEIWDTAGQERYKSLTPMYYRNSNIAIIVFDLLDHESFKKAKDWINELNFYNDTNGTSQKYNTRTSGGENSHDVVDGNDSDDENNFIIALVGNKMDLVNKSNSHKAISQTEINEFVKEKNYLYIDVSAKTGKNILKLFEDLIPNKISSKLFITENDILVDHKNAKKSAKKKILSDDLINLNDGFIDIDTSNNSKKSSCFC
ncbi:ras-domain-containing protein [Ascoidea rubescens DSM 1968]|uniref:Ras-domain-containing protein n=1 Tax=Ascoidea rubescens DSM 1968 TaxID=1344418 RepID=A0A1D2VK20_9ASCO|nr:ras-domain-containing protein [Ascoidea rubescens DSM 1968]ODV61867.1 ras-domain-containing protein [Ascoidea rubescens DSM 1968]